MNRAEFTQDEGKWIILREREVFWEGIVVKAKTPGWVHHGEIIKSKFK